MGQAIQRGERRTNVDDIFDYLHEEILSLNLRPGDKISEADIASQFGVSRQPVRDAFSRLANLDLLLIRPQRATEVRRFSMREIEKSRFVRAAVESKVLQRAAEYCDTQGAAQLDAALAQQEKAIKEKDFDSFGALDYEFHKALCEIAQADFAFDVIMSEKSKVDRLCMLGLSKEDRMPELVADHRAIADAIKDHDPEKAIEFGMRHLSRLDKTIESISATKASYFEHADE
ncbi:GntR family transcriptional regulator [Pacificibacter marinus]|uniref:Putative HTH-type transcriptional regulator YdfH n=1 Tax=Pacificibacter marinus TaxID=658057 RepID=A0A1Y5RCY6_9RHOB|nr:GntR family transcriptional regulator [Pacificibacter marinus]SEK23331.1 transcriptional regulator, GntR family [Pacificibacter marinus]SLN14525.1 putative HTH-type transcriptional regulator YdfH [Pacificibacter marinus]